MTGDMDDGRLALLDDELTADCLALRSTTGLDSLTSFSHEQTGLTCSA